MAKASAIKIQKGVPIPKTTKRGSKYPWGEMEVGDSFFVEGAPKALYASVKDYGIKIAVRKVTEKGKSGVRVWRIGAKRGRPKGTTKRRIKGITKS